MIQGCSLDRYYELRNKRTAPLLNYFSRRKNFEWMDTLPGLKEGQVDLSLEGVQCAACVWLIRELARRRENVQVSINSALGRLRIKFVPDSFDLKSFLEELQSFGYRTAPLKEEEKRSQSSGLLLRLGICTVIAMNSMILSISVYVGMTSEEGSLFTFFQTLNLLFTLVSVSVGGSFFLGKAWLALRKRILHFDIPIALGITAAFLGSIYMFFFHPEGETYFDTLNIFIALMLAGRYVQDRLVERNRSTLLTDSKLEDLKVSRISQTITEISFSKVQKGDRLIIPGGGMLPVNSKLCSSESADFNLSWVSGESKPVLLQPDQEVPAGAQLLGHRSVEVLATSDFSVSRLALLSPPEDKQDQVPLFWQWLSRWYVTLVLAFATMGFLVWSLFDLTKAVEVAIAICVITCPCALGIAIPLGRVLANRQLLALGVFSRNSFFLERLLHVKKIFFDKTGTLTLAGLTLENPEDFSKLNPLDLQVLFNATARSHHPASQSIYHALHNQNISPLELSIEEIPGKGLSAQHRGNVYFVGRPTAEKTQFEKAHHYRVSFQKNGEEIVQFHLNETVLDSAKEVVTHLQNNGKEIFQLSGDRPERVVEMARQLGIEPEKSLGACTPEAKADFVRLQDQEDTLFLGDGLNDAPAFEAAMLSGTPIWDLATLADRSDFYFLSPSLTWLPRMFDLAQLLKKIVRFNVSFAVGYNLIAILLALLGFINPLMAAILMPLSSLTVISVTSTWLKRSGVTS